MSCHVAIIVSTVIEIFSKLFYQLKISLNILRESLLALLQLKNCHSPTADSGNEDLKKPEVIYFMWIATLTLAMTGKVKVAMTNAMTKKILSLRGFVKTEVIHKKEILLILDCFVSLAMTNAITKVFAMIKIFNSINIGDYSLKMNCSLMNYSPLFIKKIY